MLDLSQIKPESTLSDLPLSQISVHPTNLVREIDQIFETMPDLPGVIVPLPSGQSSDLSQGQSPHAFAMLSRQRFTELIKRGFNRELYLNRSLARFLEDYPEPPLQLAATSQIDTAVRAAICRPRSSIYEPILVLFDDRPPGLLDIYVLLLAETHIFALVNQTVRRQQIELMRHLKSLKQEKQEVSEANQLLENQAIAIKDHNQLLEIQQLELREKNSEIAALNQRFIQVGQYFAQEGEQTFQAALEGAEALSKMTSQTVTLGRDLVSDLTIFQNTCQKIKEISKKSRHLALQVAIFANRHGRIADGIGKVASDIGTLSSETLEASQTMDLTAHQLHHRVTDLMRFSTQGTQVSQSLVHRVKTAQTALDDLIHLVQKTDRPHTFSRSLTAPGPTVHSLIERVEQAKAVLAELETMFDPTQIYNSKSLLTQERSQAISRLNAYTTTPQPME